MAYQHLNSSHEAGGAMVDGQYAHVGYLPPADLVHHLEQLHTALGVAQETNICAAHLSSDSFPANTNDLAGWIECMIEELSSNNNGSGADQQQSPLAEDSHCINNVESSSSHDSSLDTTGSPPQLTPFHYPNDTTALMSNLAGPHNDGNLLNASQPASSGAFQPTGAALYTGKAVPRESASMGEEENSGVHLVHSLLACAESIQRGDLNVAEETLHGIQLMGLPPGAMGKVAAHFVEALARRLYNVPSPDGTHGLNSTDSLSELLHFHFYETCPYLKFAHFTANQAILEAFEGQKQVHVVDFNLMHGLQWPALIQALALRPGGPPRFCLTGIGPPQPGGSDVLQEIGMKLAKLAESLNVEFDFRGVVALKLDDVKPWMLQMRHGEAVAVNSVLQLHRLLYSDGPVSAIDEVLQLVRSLNPKIFTIVEHEANHNSPSFLRRFTEALQYYSTMFDSLEACNLPPESSEQLLAEMYLGREICNIVACEDVARVERHENLKQWRLRMAKAGYRPLQLQASMLRTLFSGEGYQVEEKMGCLTLGWHTRPLIAASAWQCA